MTTFIELAVAAVVAGTSVCSDHFPQNEQRINPTELDGYGQCVAIVNDIDHGTVGNHLWIRTGEGADSVFTYVNTMKLQNKSRSDMMELVTKKVIRTVVDTSLQQDVNDLIAERDALAMQLGSTEDVTGLLGRIATLNAQIEDLNDDIDALQVQIDNFDVTSNDAQVLADARNRALDGRPEGTVGFNDVRGNTRADMTVDEAPDGTYSLSGDDLSVDVTGTTTTVSVDLAGVRASVQNQIVDVVNEAFSTGFADGFNDGYDDGYTAGYADGFADGVASVQ